MDRPNLEGQTSLRLYERAALGLNNLAFAQSEHNVLIKRLIDHKQSMTMILFCSLGYVFESRNVYKLLLDQDLTANISLSITCIGFLTLLAGIVYEYKQIRKINKSLDICRMKLNFIQVDTQADLEELEEIS